MICKKYMLFSNNINVLFQQITGHKRVESLNNYAGLGEQEAQAMGEDLGRPTAMPYQTVLTARNRLVHVSLYFPWEWN